MNKESTSKALDNLKWLLAIIVFGIAVVGNSYFVEVAFLYRVLAVLARTARTLYKKATSTK